ncbi:putative Lipid A core-O-antigen ligase-like enyme [Sterolibacterium denitrificans]|uniref:Lipid A core-O-antigen ligase-like enyme n=1 Tax=Sterolibacterium denitrificans TaxID=157592 RepID=A0A7Z7HQ82_9PROT|nr:Wzy polymerase domain-containing protein [Sterolibacterium denitrificans]SMB24085.1 putative Lipid A core-O-antigen ligase-like enyme [Sterolibacterium denitrificans]
MPQFPIAQRLTLLLLGLMLALPFLQPIHHHPIPSFYEEWLALLLGVLALASFFISRPEKISLPAILWLPGLLLLATLLQLAGGMIQIPMLGLFQSGYLLWAMALICLSASLRERFGTAWLVQVLALALLAGALASALTAYAQRLGTPVPWQILMPNSGRIYGNLGQPNLLTTQLWLGICCLIYFHELRRVRPWLLIAGLLILASACGLVASRTAWLHGLALLLLAGLPWPSRAALPATEQDEAHRTVPQAPGKLRRQRLLLLAFTLVSLIAAGEISRTLPWQHAAGQINAFDRLRSGLVSGDSRLLIWRDALTMIQAHPWLGNGTGNYAWRTVEAAAQAPAGVDTLAGAEHAHNFLLQLAADFGLPLTLAVAIFAIVWLRHVLRGPLRPPEQLALAMLMLIAIHSQLEYPLWHAEFLGLTAVLLGALGSTGKSFRLPRPQLLLIACLAALAILGTLFHDYRILDQALIMRREVRGDEADWRRRMDVFADLAQHSILGPYARSTLAVLMHPDPQKAADQSLICEAAMPLRVAPELMTKCAMLRQMTGRPAEAQALLEMTRRAFRSAEDRAAIESIWQSQEQP